MNFPGYERQLMRGERVAEKLGSLRLRACERILTQP